MTETVISCPRARSDMTPCVARDGDLALCIVNDDHSRCVGCERNVANLFRDLVKRYTDLKRSTDSAKSGR